MTKLINLAVISTVALSTLQASEVIKGSGASFPYSVYQKWIKAYNKETGIKIDYIKKGSSKGIKDAKAKTVDFAGTDRPLSPKTLKKHKLYQFPAIIGAITMAYNIPNVRNLRLSKAAIAEIALGNIKYWDNKLITTINPKIKFPHKKLTFVHRADGSGTTFNFTYYLKKSNSEWKKKFGAKKSISWAGDHHIGGKANSGVAGLIKQTPYSIGYIDYADAKSNNISMASLQNREGYFIEPTLKSFQIAADKANLKSKKHFYGMVSDSLGKDAYPILASTFILLPSEKLEQNKKIIKFFKWTQTKGQNIAKNLGFVPLPTKLSSKVEKYWTSHGIK